MNLPNRLTLIRIALIPFFVVLLTLHPFWCQLVAIAIFIIACLTDLFDGKIARARNLVTNFGKFADPIADKLLVMSGYIILVSQERMPAWVCILFLAREFIISGFRLVAAGTGNVISAGMLGKIKTTTQMIAMVALILFVPVKASTEPMLGDLGVIAANVFMYIALIMTVISGADYIIRNKSCISDM